MRLLAAEPRSVTGPIFSSKCSYVPMERLCWPCIRLCGTGEFQEQGRCFVISLNCPIPFYLIPFFPFSSFYLLVGIVGLGSSDWKGVFHSFSALQCQPLLIIIIVNNSLQERLRMHCAWPGDYHSLTRIKFNSPKVTPLSHPAKVTNLGFCYSNSNPWGWDNSNQSGVISIADQLIL